MSKHVLIRIILLCAVLFCVKSVHSQTSLLLRGGADISSNMIHHIVHDRDGVMWIATDNGVNRLDGAKNTVITNDKASSNTFVYTYEDSKRRHWLCSTDNIHLYDSNTHKPKIIEAFAVDGDKLKIHAEMMIERKDGTLLVCTSGHGVLKLMEKDGKMKFQQVSILTMKPEVLREAYYFVSCMVEDSYGCLWACTEKGIIRVDKKGKSRKIDCCDESKNRHFSFISLSRDGNLWCGNNAGGAWRINQKTLVADPVQGLAGLGVTCIVANRTNEVLVGTNDSGLWNINSKTLAVSQVKVTVDNITDNRLNIHSLDDDMYGNLWVGCYQKGVLVLPRIEERFNYIGRHRQDALSIGNACVMALGADADGSVWLAGDGDGLYAIRGGATVHYAPSATMPRTVMTMYNDSNGRIWLGTWMQGLWVMDRNTGVARKVGLVPGIESCSVFAIHEDSRHRMWIGTLGEGLFSLDVNTGEVSKAPSVASGLDYRENKNIIPNNWINDFSKGPGDILFLATCDGLGAINLKTNDCLGMFNGKNRLFEGTNISTVCYTNDNRVWFGTNNGLYCLDLKTMKSKRYQREQGLVGNMVQSIINDGHGSLWISTNTSIARLSLKSGHIISYSSMNGMYGNEFSRNAAIMSNGMIWFGGTEGLNYFKPNSLARSSGKPLLSITGLYVNSSAVTTETESGGEPILTTDIMYADNLELDYSDNSFTIELSTLNYIRNSDAQYEYKIDDSKWHTLPAGTNTVSFSNLSSGIHRIVFRALMQDDVSDEKVLTVYVRYPWYASWWAILLYLVIIALVSYMLYNRIRQRHINAINELKLKQQEEINEARIQYFMNISHEIRTPMTLVMSPLQRLITTDNDPQRQSAYHRIDRNAQRILHLINQILDMRKIDKGQLKLYFREVDMVPYLANIVSGFQDLCDMKHINISFSSNVESLKAWIDPMNFEKIVYNLCSNAYKYTMEGGRIKVVLTKKEDAYTIRVEDNGSGLDESEIDHIFDRFYQQRNPANSNTQQLGESKVAIQGTGIGLNLTRGLVQLHHGSITCANNGNGQPGCYFEVTMLIGRAHLSDDEIDVTPVKEAAPAEVVVPEPQEMPTTPTKPKTRKRIMVVEDDNEISQYLQEELSKDFNITVCGNGKVALGMLHKNKKYDLIISDVLMPEMDGLEMLRNIRQNTDMNNIPVILLTAKVTDQETIEGLEHGADAYITKPFNIDVLRVTVRNLITRQDQLKNIFKGTQNPKTEAKIKVMSPDEKLMQRILKVINANLSNPELGNDLITREVGISRVHLYRKLKELTNLSLRDYIRNIRLNEAARLLGEQKHSIAEVAMRTGFENVSYFTVVFKQKYGVPPSQYHNQVADAGEEEQAD